MPLTSPRNMFDRALKEGFAVGAFNVNNMEIIQGILQAGAEEDAPVILQVSAGARKYAGQNYIVRLVEAGLMERAISRWCCIWITGPTSRSARTAWTAASRPS